MIHEDVIIVLEVPCVACNGTGKRQPYPCSSCAGTGWALTALGKRIFDMMARRIHLFAPQIADHIGDEKARQEFLASGHD